MNNYKSILNIFKSLVLLFLMVVIYSCSRDGSDNNLYINNGKLKLGFEKSSGAFLVYNDIVNNYSFLEEDKITGVPWEIKLKQPGETEILTPSAFSYSKTDALTLILTWDDFPGENNKNLKVTAKVRLDEKEALSYWSISLNGIKNKLVTSVIFPKIKGISNFDDEKLVVPSWMGELIREPRKILSKSQSKSMEWVYPGPLSLQCLALYDSTKCGFYASCNDTQAYRKSFSFTLDNSNNLTYQMKNYPALNPKHKSYETPYEAVIGSFKGDWVTAAEQYRKWGSKQRWSSESRLKTKLVPQWLEETAIWVWNRGKSENVLVPATELRQKLGLPVNVFWHWWHGCSYDDGFPEYIPPREGTGAFIKAMSAANNNGVKAIVYMNSYQWGDFTESWKNENASLYAVKDINGKLRTHVFNIFTGKSLTNMCMATRFWKNKYSSLCDSVVNKYHTNGVYMDQACLNKMCYDPTHGHPIGGGNYWVENFGKLTGMIRSKISHNNSIVLAGEGCGEAWMPLLDAMLTLQVSRERYAGIGPVETIPFFQAVYHEYAITYGSYSSLIVPPYDELWPKQFAPKDPLKLLNKDFNKQFLMEQARSFVWGMQPTLSNYQSFLNSERREEIDYLIDLAKVRYKGLKYFLYGKFLRSPNIEIPEEELKISKLSIYAGKKGESVTSFQKRVPLIYFGTWKADDGNIGIALASISKKIIPINFSFSAADYGLLNSGEIYIVDNKSRKLLTSYSNGEIKVDFDIQAKGLCFLEVIPKKK